MPDNAGLFSEEDQKIISEWFDKKIKHSECTRCGSNNYALYSHVVGMPIATASGMNAKAGYEAVCISCNECGSILFFDADKVGVGTSALRLENPDQAAEPPQASGDDHG